MIEYWVFVRSQLVRIIAENVVTHFVLFCSNFRSEWLISNVDLDWIRGPHCRALLIMKPWTQFSWRDAHGYPQEVYTECKRNVFSLRFVFDTDSRKRKPLWTKNVVYLFVFVLIMFGEFWKYSQNSVRNKCHQRLPYFINPSLQLLTNQLN
jgi:hypothetical protein